jgi:hypothetical protein
LLWLRVEEKTDRWDLKVQQAPKVPLVLKVPQEQLVLQATKAQPALKVLQARMAQTAQMALPVQTAQMVKMDARFVVMRPTSSSPWMATFRSFVALTTF